MAEHPLVAIDRLTYYLRTLEYLKSKGYESISSNQLAQYCGINATLVRKDLSRFGSFGTRGKGYNLDQLIDNLNSILGLDREWRVALIGVGYLGKALIYFDGFRKRGFKIAAAFDKDPYKVGKLIDNVMVYDISQLEKIIPSLNIQMVVLTIPQSSAVEIYERVIKCGIKGIINFSPVFLGTDDNRGIFVKNIALIQDFETISFYLTHLE